MVTLFEQQSTGFELDLFGAFAHAGEVGVGELREERDALESFVRLQLVPPRSGELSSGRSAARPMLAHQRWGGGEVTRTQPANARRADDQ